MEHLLFGNLVDADLSLEAIFQMLAFNGRALVLILSCLLIASTIKSSAANRHILTLIAVFSVLALPIFSHVAPTIDIVVDSKQSHFSQVFPPDVKAVVFSDHANIIAPLTSTLNLSQLALAIYQGIYLLLILKVLFDNLKMFMLVRMCQPVAQTYWVHTTNDLKRKLNIQRHVQVRFSPLVNSPSTWGAFRPVVLIPEHAVHWPDHLIRSTLLHELAHIKRYDWLTQQLSRGICALYWINPLCWVAHRKLCQFAEQASDDLALHTGINNAHYASDLVNVAEHTLSQRKYNRAALCMTASTMKSELSQRIFAILNTHKSHTPINRQQITLNAALVLLFLAPIVSLRANYVERIETRLNPKSIAMVESSDSRVNTETVFNLLEDTLDEEELNTGRSEIDVPFDLEKAKQAALGILPFTNTQNSLKELNDSLAIETPKVQIKFVEIPAKEAIKRMARRFRDATLNENHSQLDIASKPISALRIDSTINVVNTLTQPTAQEYDVSSEFGSSFLATNEPPPQVQPAAPINLVVPKYPRKALTKGIEGEVKVEYSLNKFGEVIDARIVSASPTSIFDKHVLKAIKKSSFQPQRVNGKAVATNNLTEKFVFVLKS